MLKSPLNNHQPAAAKATIEVNLNRLSQLFNSLDPSPFHERDLDPDAEEYIIGSAEEIPRHRPLLLLIHLPQDQLPDNGASSLNDAIHNYFAYREVQERRKLRLLFHDGRVALLTGITFLFGCLLVRKLATSFWNNAASDILAEGMLIMGWVAMWRPLEIFLYEWLPIYRRSRILQKLSKVAVALRAKSDTG